MAIDNNKVCGKCIFKCFSICENEKSPYYKPIGSRETWDNLSEFNSCGYFKPIIKNNITTTTKIIPMTQIKKTGKRIPISQAKEIAKKFGYSEVIIHAYDSKTNIQCVCTYGKTLEDCKNAAEGGNAVKKLFCWDDVLCNSKPIRVKKAEKNQANKQGINNKSICPRCGIEHTETDCSGYCTAACLQGY